MIKNSVDMEEGIRIASWSFVMLSALLIGELHQKELIDNGLDRMLAPCITATCLHIFLLILPRCSFSIDYSEIALYDFSWHFLLFAAYFFAGRHQGDLFFTIIKASKFIENALFLAYFMRFLWPARSKANYVPFPVFGIYRMIIGYGCHENRPSQSDSLAAYICIVNIAIYSYVLHLLAIKFTSFFLVVSMCVVILFGSVIWVYMIKRREIANRLAMISMTDVMQSYAEIHPAKIPVVRNFIQDVAERFPKGGLRRIK